MVPQGVGGRRICCAKEWRGAAGAMLSGTPKSAQEQCERAVEPESEARASGAAGKSCTE